MCSLHEVSVIIVSWNTKQHLLNCISSLVNQNGIKEVLVVDNGSTDGSPDVVETQFPLVQLIRNDENLGFARANNIGIRVSTGRYVCLINSDVIVLDGCIEKLIEFMDKNPSVGMSGPRILNPDGSLQVSCRHFPSIWNNICQVFGFNKLFPKSVLFSEQFMKYWAHDEIRKVGVLRGCFWMVRREALDKIGLLDEDFFFYGEDIDWCKRFQKAGWDVAFYPGAEAIHIGAASSSNAPTRFYIEMQKADLQYWRKYHGRIGEFSYRIVILIRHGIRVIVGAVLYLFPGSRKKQVLFKLRRSVACVRWCLHI